MFDKIVITGAREHNLKNISLEIPKNKLIVITGVSGSGKSSLAFDTIYAEGQRRYVESLSSYARQFLGKVEKPDVEKIEGLSPSIAIEQINNKVNPRSTIATSTEIYDYLRILYSSIGIPYDPKTGDILKKYSKVQITESLIKNFPKNKLILLAPLINWDKKNVDKTLESLKSNGFVRIRYNDIIIEIIELQLLLKNSKLKIKKLEVVVDRLIIKSENESRLLDSIETALNLSYGIVLCLTQLRGEEILDEKYYSNSYYNYKTNYRLGDITPRHFSFNSQLGACSTCQGLGFKLLCNTNLLIPNDKKSINDNAIVTWWDKNKKLKVVQKSKINDLAKFLKIDIEEPFYLLNENFKNALFYGFEKNKFKYEGLVNQANRLLEASSSSLLKFRIKKFMTPLICDSCDGKRLNNKMLSVYLNYKNKKYNINDLTNLNISQAKELITNLKLNKKEHFIAKDIIHEIDKRLSFLKNVGLNYLTLNRQSDTLSGGESQRIRLASQIGSGLSGVIYVLDEPSIGLHQRDNIKLINTLKKLRDLGNTIIVVEHDEETILNSDYVIDIGPFAGIHGGELLFNGTPQELIKNKKSLTAKYLKHKLNVNIAHKEIDNKIKNQYLEIKGAKENNLKNINVRFPVGEFIVVAGVSGSGKSSLVNDILSKSLSKHFYKSKNTVGKHDKIIGIEHISGVGIVNQSPIGARSRSNPATYTGVFTKIREIFASTPLAKMRAYKSNRFSFNIEGGRCESCQGTGEIKIDMHFLNDIFIECESCNGKRYKKDTLDVIYKGKNIFQILDMTIEEAFTFFSKIPNISRQLEALINVGLAYLKLGQNANTLSGGESQRIKLASELGKRSSNGFLYIFDEPTTGLHFFDIEILLKSLFTLRDKGNTVIVIEHNLDVIKHADWIIELGPEGGNKGGNIIAEGKLKEVIKNNNSLTGQYLKTI